MATVKQLAKNIDSVNSRRKRYIADELNQFYNIFMNGYKWEGDIDDQQIDFIMRRFWGKGTIACYKLPTLLTPAFADYSPFAWNQYDYVTELNLIPNRGVPETITPIDVMKVDEEVVIGWCQRNHKPIYDKALLYAEKLADIQMTIDTNLVLHKMPFMFTGESTDKTKFDKMVEDIANDKLKIFVDTFTANSVQALNNNVPYIIDKLYEYKTAVRNEFLTYLGVDNMQSEKAEEMRVDEVNANNEFINNSGDCFLDLMKEFCKRINQYLGFNINVKATARPVLSFHDETKKEINEIDEEIEDEE